MARKGDGAAVAPGARNLIDDAAASPGAPLPGKLRGRLETSLRTDLDAVRVHTGGESAAAAKAVGATAYTTGQDIHFGAGQYNPESAAGQSLVAHEVAHTVQQRGTTGEARQNKLEISSPGDAHEVEAEQFSQSFVSGSGQTANVTPVTQSSVARMVINRSPGDPAEQHADTVATAVAGAATVLVDDNAPIAAGQIAKRDFIAQLKPQLEAAASDELGPLLSVAGCPYIAHYLDLYAGRPACDAESFIRRFTGSTATTPQALIADLLVRVRAGVRSWRETGKVPPEAAAAAGDQGAPIAAVPATTPSGGPPAIQNKDEPGKSKPGSNNSPTQVLERLGGGKPLDSSTQRRMGSAFGTNFADVRLHDDPQGNALASEQGALAFTVGSHIAFASGRYSPGTIEGDALLAHELTHVLQQRGTATPAPPQKKTTGTQSGDAEHDADRGAEAAVRHLHGDEKSEHAGADVSSDFQLQRCEGVDGDNYAERQGSPFDHKPTHLQGDAFEVGFRISSAGSAKQGSALNVDIAYVGQDDASQKLGALSFNIAGAKTPQPKVTVDKDDAWSTATVDMFGDASWIVTVSHAVRTEGNWSPKSRTHTFSGKSPFGTSVTPDITIKSKDAVPGTGADPAAPKTETADVRALRIDVAAMTTKHWFDEISGDPTFGVDLAAVPWAMLKTKVDADATSHATAPTTSTPDDSAEALRLTRLGIALEHSRPMLRALAVARKPEAYLPDIAPACLALIAGVRAKYDAAIGASWDGPVDSQLAAADQEFNAVWFRIVSLYLEKGKGVDSTISDAQATASQIGSMRKSLGGAATKYPKLESQLGVPDSQMTTKGGETQISDLRQRANEVRDKFMAGSPDALHEVTSVVEDAQVTLGLASLLCCAEVFRQYKSEMSGIVGGAFDAVGRDLTKVCESYASQFDAIAAGVEGQILGDSKNLPTIGRPAVSQFQALLGGPFQADRQAIESRIKTVALIHVLASTLAIIGVAALTGGAAGAATAEALGGAATTAGAVGGFAAEVVTFTLVSRLGNEAAFGKNETSLGEDLITNALMFGMLKTASAAYGRVFKVFAKTSPKMFKAGGLLLGFAGLEVFADIHYRVKEGKWMDGGQLAQSALQNGVMMAAMELGSFLGQAAGARIKGQLYDLAKAKLDPIEAKIAALHGEVDALRAMKPDERSTEQASALLAKIQTLWDEELKVLADAARDAGKADKGKGAEAARAFQETVQGYTNEIAKLEIKLASVGLEADLGPGKSGNMFKPVSPGFVTYRAEALSVLKEYYQENGGSLTEVPGKKGMFSGKDSSGEVFYELDSEANSVFDKDAKTAEKEAAAARQKVMEKYKDLTAADFKDESDPRLMEIKDAADAENVKVAARVRAALDKAGVKDVDIQARGKSLKSILGKLQETPGMKIGDIKDLSGIRINITKVRTANFAQYNQIKSVIQKELGIPDSGIKDYNTKPNPWGYTGRIHLFDAGESEIYSEIQIGSQELSEFIEKKFTMPDGKSIELHDLTGYKGKLYGKSLSPELQAEYTRLIGKITEVNKGGNSLRDVPEAQAEVDAFLAKVQAFIDAPAVPAGP